MAQDMKFLLDSMVFDSDKIRYGLRLSVRVRSNMPAWSRMDKDSR